MRFGSESDRVAGPLAGVVLALACLAGTGLCAHAQSTPPAPRPAAPAPTAVPPTPPATPTATPPPTESPADDEFAEEIDAPPPIEFEPKRVEFGFVQPKSLNTAPIKIHNKSDKPLTILAVQPSCKCTTLDDLSGQVINPGEYATLTPQLKAQSSPGPKTAQIKVLIEGYSQVAQVELAAEVAYAVRAQPGYINAINGQATSGRIVVSSIDGKPFSITSAHGAPPQFEGFDPTKDAPTNKYLLKYDLTTFTRETMPRFFVIETDHPDCATVDVMVRHEWVTESARKFALKPSDLRFNLGKLTPGEAKEFEVEFEAVSASDPILTVMSSTPAVTVTMEEPRRTKSADDKDVTAVKVKLVPGNEHRGLIYGTITFFTSNKEQPITFFGSIR